MIGDDLLFGDSDSDDIFGEKKKNKKKKASKSKKKEKDDEEEAPQSKEEEEDIFSANAVCVLLIFFVPDRCRARRSSILSSVTVILTMIYLERRRPLPLRQPLPRSPKEVDPPSLAVMTKKRKT